MWILDTDHFKCLHPKRTTYHKPPVVLLLGWAGASDRALSKYADLMSEWGYISVRSVQPTFLLFSPTHLLRRKYTLALLRYLKRHRLDEHPLILYSFSNGGGFIVEQIRSLAEDKVPTGSIYTTSLLTCSRKNLEQYSWLRSRVIGFVYDSSPCYMHSDMGPKLIAANESPGATRMLKTCALMSMSSMTALFYLGKKSREEEYWENMTGLDWRRPSLFLYSKDDPLCDAEKLHSLIAEKERRGHEVQSVCWDESDHCGHLKRHRTEYIEALQKFLDHVEHAFANRNDLRARM